MCLEASGLSNGMCLVSVGAPTLQSHADVQRGCKSTSQARRHLVDALELAHLSMSLLDADARQGLHKVTSRQDACLHATSHAVRSAAYKVQTDSKASSSICA